MVQIRVVEGLLKDIVEVDGFGDGLFSFVRAGSVSSAC